MALSSAGLQKISVGQIPLIPPEAMSASAAALCHKQERQRHGSTLGWSLEDVASHLKLSRESFLPKSLSQDRISFQERKDDNSGITNSS